MRARGAVVAVVAIAVLAPGVARADDLAGEWVHPIEGGEAKLSLRSDGSLEFMGMTGKWKASPGKLTLVADTGEAMTYEAKLEGDRLTLTGGDTVEPLTFTRAGKPAPAASPAPTQDFPRKDPAGGPDVNQPATKEELSRKPQPVPKDAQKFTPKFSGKTRVAKTPSCEVTLPEGWTFQPGEQGGVQFLIANPGLAPTDVLRQQIIFWIKPVKLADMDKGFKDRLDAGATEADALFNQNGLSMTRQKTQLLDAPGGLMGRLDYAGTMTNQFVQGQKATGLVAVVQRKMYDVALTIVTLDGNTKDSTDDALAILDSTKCFLKDRDQELEKKIVGCWVVPSKTGNSLETYDFSENGTYKWHFESSYTGSIKDSGGNETANWGTASQNDEAGRYEIRGDIMFFVSNKGEQGLHVEGPYTAPDGKVSLKIGSKRFVR